MKSNKDKAGTMVGKFPGIEAWVADRYSNWAPEVTFHHVEHMEARGQFALKMIERWGMVAGVDGPEDSAGRKTLSLMPVDEVVSRAFAATDLAFAEVEKRGWLHAIPGPQAIRDLLSKDQEPAA